MAVVPRVGKPQLGCWPKAECPEQPWSDFLTPAGASGVLPDSLREEMVEK